MPGLCTGTQWAAGLGALHGAMARREGRDDGRGSCVLAFIQGLLAVLVLTGKLQGRRRGCMEGRGSKMR